MKFKIIGIMFAMMVLLVSNILAVPLDISIPDIDIIIQGDNLTLAPYVYDESGLLINAPCNYKLNNVVISNNTQMNTTGDFKLDVWCVTNISGGHYTDNFIVSKETTFGIWAEPTDWTFPIIYLTLTFILIGFALAYGSSILGVLGSIMLIMSYFLIGATSPILFAPLLIVGFLLAFKFATLD